MTGFHIYFFGNCACLFMMQGGEIKPRYRDKRYSPQNQDHNNHFGQAICGSSRSHNFVPANIIKWDG